MQQAQTLGPRRPRIPFPFTMSNNCAASLGRPGWRRCHQSALLSRAEPGSQICLAGIRSGAEEGPGLSLSPGLVSNAFQCATQTSAAPPLGPRKSLINKNHKIDIFRTPPHLSSLILNAGAKSYGLVDGSADTGPPAGTGRRRGIAAAPRALRGATCELRGKTAEIR